MWLTPIITSRRQMFSAPDRVTTSSHDQEQIERSVAIILLSYLRQFVLPIWCGARHVLRRRYHSGWSPKRSTIAYSLKARSHDPISRIRFFVPKIERRSSNGPISRLCFCRRLSSFKKSVGWNRACSISIRFFFSNYWSVSRKIIFTVFTRSNFRNQQQSDLWNRIVWTGLKRGAEIQIHTVNSLQNNKEIEILSFSIREK